MIIEMSQGTDLLRTIYVYMKNSYTIAYSCQPKNVIPSYCFNSINMVFFLIITFVIFFKYSRDTWTSYS